MQSASKCVVMLALGAAAACGGGDDSAGDSATLPGNDAGSTADGHANTGDAGSPKDGSVTLGDGSTTTDACSGEKPTAANTGAPSGVALTVVNDDVTVTADNTVIDAQDIHGFLTIKASHVEITRSIVRGKATAATTAIIRIDSGTDILIEDTEVSATTPSVDVDGVLGSNFTARRLNIHGGVDGMKLGDNSTVECSYIHDLASFASDPNQGGGATHNDCIQILEGTTITISGNQLVAAKDQNSAIQITEDFGAVSAVHIDANWADGGGCTFNFSHKGAASLGNLFTSNNRFGRNSFFNCPILKSTKTTLVSSGDVWDDDGTTVPIQTHD